MRGHVRRRGKTWQVIVSAGRDASTGKRRYVSRTVAGTKADAEAVLSVLLVEVGRGQHVGRSVSVGELVDRWFEMAKPDLSPSTVQVTGWYIDLYITPRLGPLSLRKLSAVELDRFYADLRSSGGAGGAPLSPRTVRRVHNIVRRALQQAVRWGWISENPAVHASPPRLQRPDPQPPSPDDVGRLLDAAHRDDPDFAMFLRLAAATGARRGELCGLRWDAVDLEHRAVLISRSIVRGTEGLVEKDTKTHQARRVALDRTTVAMLAEHRNRAAARMEAGRVALPHDGYVFSYQADGSAPWPPNSVSQRFRRLRRKVGAPTVRLHDLRHYVATRLIVGGVPVRTVAGRLGHANAATTLGVYAHFVEASDQDAADLLGELLDGSGGDSIAPSRADHPGIHSSQ